MSSTDAAAITRIAELETALATERHKNIGITAEVTRLRSTVERLVSVGQRGIFFVSFPPSPCGGCVWRPAVRPHGVQSVNLYSRAYVSIFAKDGAVLQEDPPQC